jgi:hypothetical protein
MKAEQKTAITAITAEFDRLYNTELNSISTTISVMPPVPPIPSSFAGIPLHPNVASLNPATIPAPPVPIPVPKYQWSPPPMSNKLSRIIKQDTEPSKKLCSRFELL